MLELAAGCQRQGNLELETNLCLKCQVSSAIDSGKSISLSRRRRNLSYTPSRALSVPFILKNYGKMCLRSSRMDWSRACWSTTPAIDISIMPTIERRETWMTMTKILRFSSMVSRQSMIVLIWWSRCETTTSDALMEYNDLPIMKIIPCAHTLVAEFDGSDFEQILTIHVEAFMTWRLQTEKEI